LEEVVRVIVVGGIIGISETGTTVETVMSVVHETVVHETVVHESTIHVVSC
jgi:hypothetical protein